MEQRYTENMTGPDPTLIKANPPPGSGGKAETTKKHIFEQTKSKVNLALLKQKLLVQATAKKEVQQPTTYRLHNLAY